MFTIEPAVLGAFILTASAIVMSPGPDTMIILRHTLGSGRGVGLAAVAGVQLGLVLHTLLAVAGISFIIAASPFLFKTLALVGAAYLAWLGIQGFRGGGHLALNENGPKTRASRALREAVLCNILNPKVIILFLALFPNFVDTGRGDVTAQLITLAAVLIVINVIWQAPMAWAGEILRRWLATPGRQIAVSRASGSVLLFFAVLMLYENLF